MDRKMNFFSFMKTGPFDSSLVGGKAANLARMTDLGLPVPPWLVLRQTAWLEFVEENKLGPLLARAQPTQHYEDEVLARFLASSLPKALVEELQALVPTDNQSPASTLTPWLTHDTPLAVRSSGIDEDGVAHSFAGQFSSFLFQRGRPAVEESIKRCWASAFSARILSYRASHDLPLVGGGVAVVIQQMIDASAAGVAFSQHPLKVLEPGTALISAVYGAGEGLVSGLLDADAYVVDTKTRKIESQIANKTEFLGLDEKTGTLVHRPVAPSLSKSPVLGDDEIHQITATVMDLQKRLGNPQDMEWVLGPEGDQTRSLYVVQTRPITTVPPPSYYDPNVNGTQVNLWDNSNIIESYSGVTTPLTFSFASRAYNEVYIQFCHVMGVPETLITQNSGTFRNLLGLLRGRIYYNLPNWYALVLLLPGSSNNKSFMETMMGVKQQLKPDQEDLFAFAARPPIYSLPQKTKLTLKTLMRFWRIDSIVTGFFAEFNRGYQEARSKDYSKLSLPQLAKEYLDLEDSMLKRWKAPIINDYLCMIFFGLIKKLTEKWLSSTNPTLQNDLLCGEGGLDSTEPTKRLMAIAAKIDGGPHPYRDEFLRQSPKELKAVFRTTGLPADLQKEFEQFLDLYGFRCINELKLEELDLHDDPEFVFSSVQSYIKTKSYRDTDFSAREQKIRAQAEGVIRAELSGLRLAVFQFVLKHTRKAVKNRENLRFARTKVFGISRHIFRAMGQKLHLLDFLSDPNDIFYLTVDEIIQFIEGRAASSGIKSLTSLRRQEFEGYNNTSSLPDRLLTYGAVGASLPYIQVFLESDLLKKDLDMASLDPNKMYGTSCSPGVVEGVVRIVKNLQDAQGLDGQILVTSRTDPGWVPLFPSCSALLVERGSLLSHSAVVARELGLPTIVGISGGLMERLKTGDRVRVDATNGVIEILGSGEPQSESHS